MLAYMFFKAKPKIIKNKKVEEILNLNFQRQ